MKVELKCACGASAKFEHEGYTPVSDASDKWLDRHAQCAGARTVTELSGDTDKVVLARHESCGCVVGFCEGGGRVRGGKCALL